MTNKLEKYFFDTFGIRPYYKYLLLDKTSRNHNGKLFNKTDFIDFVKSGKDYLLFKVIKYYPEITSDILLELICIHNQYSHPLTIYSTKEEFLKNDILECTIDIINYFYEHEIGEYSKLKQQVRTLFEER